MALLQSGIVLSGSGALPEGLPFMSCPPPAIGFAGLSTSSPSWLESVESCAATGSEPDEASGVVTSGSRSTVMTPLLLVVAKVAVRFPPALDDEAYTVWESSKFPAGVVAGSCTWIDLNHIARSHSLASW